MSWENARLNNECGANCTAEDFRRIDQQMARLESAGTLAEIGKRGTLTPEQANHLVQSAIELAPRKPRWPQTHWALTVIKM